ncbi:molecular chaperone Hsp90 [Clostridium sulfidigenes]|uniref:Molecular chaperone Hsp90 n=1 Tax=Clostridium sulfidigenes TaxID=318464 RepID=A0A084JA75_9CLOT|nr:molecular chaperone HtpG [Clostridium sulfidigenes]KEZ85859.1 molecular chaperone Hsp90 [Clostridium sulfidigenes]
MLKENGNISIHTENIMPIIKKWLYSDKDIFIRELISNGCDAINKLERLVTFGEATVEESKYEVTVSLNKDEKTIKFIDNGIGMTSGEVKKYINQVAFSGAEEFLSKYKDKIDEGKGIIGHFGLGFYSAFMVSEKVEIDTLSYKEGEEAVKWICEGGTEYEIESSERTSRGTTVTLYISEDSNEFLDYYKLRQIIKKHCNFFPVEIYLIDENEKKDDKDSEKDIEKTPLNDTKPLWMKAPKDCTDEEYKEFYRKVFNEYNDPLFWIHMNVDYPFNLKGILYFPKLKHEFEATEGEVKLYNKQVFVADNIKEVIPEFLLLLKGVIDCEDIPLNVSRSFLQKDSNVSKVSRHIVNKVADKLTSLFKNHRDEYNDFWKDINIFIKYGCLRDEKFYDKVKDILIFKTTNGDHVTLKQYLENNKENHDKKVIYVNDEKQQSQYIKMLKDNNLEAVILNTTLDSHFITLMESKEEGVQFSRIDSDLTEILKADAIDESPEENKAIEEIFKNSINKEQLKISIEPIKTEEVPAMITLSEQSRRMAEMSVMFGGGDMSMFPKEETLVVNSSNPLIKKLFNLSKDENKKDLVNDICNHVYDLAMISHGQLGADEMSDFIKRSNDLLGRLIN